MKENNKKIIFIANGFGLAPVISGGEIRLFNLLKNIKNKFDFELFTTSGGALAAKNYFKKIFFKIVVTKCSFFLKKEYILLQRFAGYIISGLDTYFKLKKQNFNAVYTSSDGLCDILPAYLLKKRKKVKWFAMLHHKYANPFSRPGNFLKNFLLFILQNLTLFLISKKADFVFVLETQEGENLKNFLIKNKFTGKIIKVKNGINLDKRTIKKNIKKDKKLALFVGGLRAAKGLYDIVPIWQLVIKNKADLKLVITGSGAPKDMKFLKNEIKNNKLNDKIFLMGYLPYNKLNNLLDKAFVFFFPSHEEGFGISILEALMHNCIPIVYDLPAFKVFKHFLIKVPCFNKEKFADMVVKVFNRKIKFNFDKSFLKKFSWNKILKKEIDFLSRNC